MHWDILTQLLLNALIVVPSGKLCLRVWALFCYFSPLSSGEDENAGPLLQYWNLSFENGTYHSATSSSDLRASQIPQPTDRAARAEFRRHPSMLLFFACSYW
jgi:hypothetical protein